MAYQKDYPQCPFAEADLGNFEPERLENGKCLGVVTNRQIHKCCNATANWMIKKDKREAVEKISKKVDGDSNADKQRSEGINLALQTVHL